MARPKKAIPSHEWPAPRRHNGHWCYWWFEQVYRENIHLIWPVTEKQRRAYITHYFGAKDFQSDPEAVYAGRVTEILPSTVKDLDATGQVIALAEWQGRSRDYGILAHEVLHVVGNMLSTRKVVYDNAPTAENEAYTYLMEHLFTRCHEAISLARK